MPEPSASRVVRIRHTLCEGRQLRTGNGCGAKGGSLLELSPQSVRRARAWIAGRTCRTSLRTGSRRAAVQLPPSPTSERPPDPAAGGRDRRLARRGPRAIATHGGCCKGAPSGPVKSLQTRGVRRSGTWFLEAFTPARTAAFGGFYTGRDLRDSHRP